MVEMIGFFISALSLLYLFTKGNRAKESEERGQSIKEGSLSLNPGQNHFEDPFQTFLNAIEKGPNAIEGNRGSPPPLPGSKKRKLSTHKQLSAKEKGRGGGFSHQSNKQTLSKERQGHLKPMHHQEFSPHPLSLSIPLSGEKREKYRRSRLQSAIQRLGHRQDLLIYQEIIGKPKSLRSEIDPN